jgi:hypothetical protein
MDHLQKPHSCHAIGLNCRDCVASTALQLALVCGGRVSGSDARRMFFAMFVDSACSPMVGDFVEVYQASAASVGFSAAHAETLTCPFPQAEVAVAVAAS